MDGSGNDTTYEVLQRALRGDSAAKEVLCTRLVPYLRRLATRRLPRWAREGADTDDLVQEAIFRTLARPGYMKDRPDFRAYLRRALLNAIHDRVEKARRKGQIPVDAVPGPPSPLEELIGKERIARFEAALERLSPEDRELVVCRVEFNMTHREIAEETGRPSPDAARMAVARALVRLAAEIDRES